MAEAVLGLTARWCPAYISNNRLSGEQLPELIQAVYRSLSTAGAVAAAADAKIAPKVEVKKSIFADRIVCLACGASFSMLKRHLHAEHRAHADRIPRAVWIATGLSPGRPGLRQGAIEAGEEDRPWHWKSWARSQEDGWSKAALTGRLIGLIPGSPLPSRAA